MRPGARRAAGAHLVAFPEMVLTGYPVEDLALRRRSRGVRARPSTRWPRGSAPTGSATRSSSSATSTPPPTPRPSSAGPPAAPQNAAAFLHRGEVVARYAKHHLPNYGVFDEFRYFVPGTHADGRARARRRRRRRDLRGPLAGRRPGRATARGADAGLLVVLNGSPYERNKDDVAARAGPQARRRGRLRRWPTSTWSAARTSWSSTATRSWSPPTARCWPGRRSSSEELLVVDLDLPAGIAAASTTPTTAATAAAYASTRDRCSRAAAPYERAARPLSPSACDDDAEVYARAGRRPARLRRARTGSARWSSGCPAASTRRWSAAIACRRDRRRERVRRVDAERLLLRALAGPTPPSWPQRTGLHYSTRADRADGRGVPSARSSSTGLAEENLQARVRGTTLMALSNQHGHLVLATGNKSELAVGYSTLYGDAVGGYAPIKDVPEDAGVGARALAQRRGRVARRDAADPGELDHQAAVGRAAPGPARQRLAAATTQRARRACSTTTSSRTAAAPSCVAAGFDPALVERVLAMVDRGRVQAAAVPAGPEDLAARRSAATGGCRSRTAGASTAPGALARGCPRGGTIGGQSGDAAEPPRDRKERRRWRAQAPTRCASVPPTRRVTHPDTCRP